MPSIPNYVPIRMEDVSSAPAFAGSEGKGGGGFNTYGTGETVGVAGGGGGWFSDGPSVPGYWGGSLADQATGGGFFPDSSYGLGAVFGYGTPAALGLHYAGGGDGDSGAAGGIGGSGGGPGANGGPGY